MEPWWSSGLERQSLELHYGGRSADRIPLKTLFLRNRVYASVDQHARNKEYMQRNRLHKARDAEPHLDSFITDQLAYLHGGSSSSL